MFSSPEKYNGTYWGAYWHSTIEDFEEDGVTKTSAAVDRQNLSDLNEAIWDVHKLGLSKQKREGHFGVIVQKLAWSRKNIDGMFQQTENEGVRLPEDFIKLRKRILRQAKLSRLRLHKKGILWTTNGWKEKQLRSEIDAVVDMLIRPAVKGFGVF